jgi:serine/threonine protein kinase
LQRSRRAGPAVVGATTLAQSARVHELLFHARANDLAKLKKFVAKEKLNLLSTSACDHDGRSALHVAAASNACDVVTWLLQQGAEVNVMDAFLRTPLREAADAGHADMQRMLIAAGGMVHFNDAHLVGDWGSFCDSSHGGGAGAGGGGGAGAGGGGGGGGSGAGLPRGGGTSLQGSANGANGRPPPPPSEPPHFPPLAAASHVTPRYSGGDGNGSNNNNPSAAGGSAFTGEDWELDPASLELSANMLGVGAFGEVYAATWRGARVAVKRLKGAFADDTAALAEFRAELAVWCRLHHPHVCQFLGAVTRGGGGAPPSLVLELCPLGNLGTLLQRHATWGTFIKWDDAIRYTAGIAAGVHYLHGRRPHAVMHRDLKPANCLLDGSNNIKLADFGLSKLLRAAGGNEGSQHGRGATADGDVADKAFLLTGETGAYKYMCVAAHLHARPHVLCCASVPNPPLTPRRRAAHRAPEVYRHERYSCKVDVYAFAFICYEMYEGLYRAEEPAAHAAAAAAKSAPFRPDLALLTALGSKRCLEMGALIRRCWDPDPKKRPCFALITADVRNIRKLKEYDMPDGVAGSGKRGSAPSRRSSGGLQGGIGGGAGGGGAAGGCCAVQ